MRLFLVRCLLWSAALGWVVTLRVLYLVDRRRAR